MTGFPTGGSENTLRHGHAADIFGTGFAANENNLFALRGPFFGIGCGENNLAHRGTRNSINACAENGALKSFLVDLGIDDGIEETFYIFRPDAKNGIFVRDEFFIGHVDRHAKGRRRSAFAGARLQHIELAFFDSELHVLHVSIMLFKFCSNFFKLRVKRGKPLSHFAEMHRSANAGDHVFALSVHQIVAVKFFFPGTGIARETDARPGIFSCVSEHHLHDIDGGAKKAGYFFDATIGDGLLGHPRAEHGANRAPQLLHWIIREFLPALFLEVFLEFGDQVLPSTGGNSRVFLNSETCLECVQAMFEILLWQTHHDGRVHLHESAIGIIGKTLVVYACRKPCDALVVKAEV